MEGARRDIILMSDINSIVTGSPHTGRLCKLALFSANILSV